MKYKVDNAIIMAAGTASRFAPLSYEYPKALAVVKGEVLIERQIRQLHEAGIDQVIIVTGYKSEKFEYLKDKLGVELVHNPEYLTRNNNGSIYAVRDFLGNSYICSADNYFSENPFESYVDDGYYAAVYSDGPTSEWCLSEDAEGYIDDVKVGGSDAWYMLGHVFWTEDFSRRFVEILNEEYDLPETKDKLWEKIYMAHLDELKLRIRKYPSDLVYEFDTLDELREFDESYVEDTRSAILKDVAMRLNCRESELNNLAAYKTNDNSAAGFTFRYRDSEYRYCYETKEIEI